MYGDTRLEQARRWAKFPATILFVLSVIWLLRSFFELGPEQLQRQTHTGVGVLGIVWDVIVIPVGGAVIGIYLLLKKRWAAPVAALLPIIPLLHITLRKAQDVQQNFHDYNTQASLTKLYEGLVDLLVAAGMWALYVLMLVYLWKVWVLLRERPRWNISSGSSAGASIEGAAPSRGDRSEVADDCYMLPETDDVEAL